MSLLAVPAPGAEKIKVLLIDGQNNHNWKQTTPVLVDVDPTDFQLSLDELRKALPGIKVWADDTLQSGPTPPTVHFVFTDRSGASMVLEFVKGEQRIYDGVAQVLTNAPTYDWHVTNLRNYLGMTSGSPTT